MQRLNGQIGMKTGAISRPLAAARALATKRLVLRRPWAPAVSRQAGRAFRGWQS